MSQPLFHTIKNIILASSSPRRQEFLHNLGLEFTIKPASIDETPSTNEPAKDFVQRMAAAKAAMLASLHPESFIIGADTIISFQGAILGKPKDKAEALHILQELQGIHHEVITALSLCCLKENIATTLYSVTTVTFGNFSKETLTAYVQSGEPMDKAGAYAIQGQGSFLVKEIAGSCSNVIGLPMHELIPLLLTHGVITPRKVE